MKIPAFWSQATVTQDDPAGRTFCFTCWRSSDQSEADANAAAREAAERLVQRLMRGETLQRYGYGASPMREETVERLTDGRGQLVGAVTRNAYGCLVLNTAGALFIDLDFPPAKAPASAGGFFARLFGRPRPSNKAEVDPETQAVRTFERFVADNRDWGVRLYRTAAGLRGLVTHDLFSPTCEQTLAMLNSLGADPLYVRLCRVQQCFRARLSPKPWRCGHFANTVRWPIQDDLRRQWFAQWLDDYSRRQADYATCRFVAALGNPRVHPDVERIIELHDRMCRTDAALPLA